MPERNNIDDLFHNEMRDFETQPSSRVWENIADELDHQEAAQGWNWKQWGMAASFFLGMLTAFALTFLFPPIQEKMSDLIGVEEPSEQQATGVEQNTSRSSPVLALYSQFDEPSAKKQEGQPSQTTPAHPQAVTDDQSTQAKRRPSDNNVETTSSSQHTSSVSNEKTKPASQHVSATSMNEEKTEADNSESSTKEEKTTTQEKTNDPETLKASAIPSISTSSIENSSSAIPDSAAEELYNNYVAHNKPREDLQLIDDNSLTPQGFYAGVAGGAKHAWIINEDRYNKASNTKLASAFNLSPGYGVTVGYNFSDKLALEGEWLLNEKGHRYQGSYSKEVAVNYSQFAALVKLRATKLSGKNAIPVANSLVFGPYYGMMTSAEIATQGDVYSVSNEFSPHDYGVIAGLEHERYVSDHLSLSIGARGHLGLTDAGTNQFTTDYFNAGVGLHATIKYIQ